MPSSRADLAEGPSGSPERAVGIAVTPGWSVKGGDQMRYPSPVLAPVDSRLEKGGRSDLETVASVRGTFLPFCLPDIGEDEIEEVVQTLRSGWITTGPRTKEFERRFAEYRTLKEEIEANPEIREQPKWFEKISEVYWKMARAYRVVRMYELQQTESRQPVRVHAVRIGDMAIVTHPLAQCVGPDVLEVPHALGRLAAHQAIDDLSRGHVPPSGRARSASVFCPKNSRASRFMSRPRLS